MAAAFARAAAAGERPERTVVFALWNGEEQGSLGAEAFAQGPRPDLEIVANINLDMVGRDEDADPKDARFHGFPRRTPAESDHLLHVLGYSRSPALARLVRTANEAVGLELRMEYDENAQNLLQRSDQWAFLRRGIPAIFLTTGLHPDYHEPSDDAERVDYGKLERITELAARVAWLAADAQP
jgi:Zn-dependent M28 family amino/carboxypeptidase